MRYRLKIFFTLACVVLISSLTLSQGMSAWAGELLLFPSLSVLKSSINNNASRDLDIQPALDIFYAAEAERMAFLAEIFISEEEKELERLQIGYSPAPFSTIWLGRFHSPISYWNNAYHHGVYMQPSITRPGIVRYEDDAGILPVHTTGFLFESSTELSAGRLKYAVALGAGPVLREGLHSVDILAPRSEPGRLSISSKISLLPADSETDETGFYAGYTEIPMINRLYVLSKQTLAGAYFNKEIKKWHFIGEFTAVRNKLESLLLNSSSGFTNVYVHGEYNFTDAWAGYGRVEKSSGADNPYLNMFHGFVREETILGSRWEPLRNHAFKFELWHSQHQGGHISKGGGLQWSMVIQ